MSATSGSRYSHPVTAFLFILFVPFFFELFFVEYSERELINRTGWLILLWSLSYLIHIRFIHILVGVFFTLTGTVDIAYAIEFKGIFTTSSVEAIAHTNRSEAFEFLISYFSIPTFLSLLTYLLISLWLVKQLILPPFPLSLRYRALSICFFTLFSYLIVDGIVVKHKYWKRLPGIVGAYPTYLKSSQSLAQEIQQRKALVENTAITFTNSVEAPQTYVFIVGESATRNHMSIYGYSRNTNPLLSKHADLIALKNVIANFVQTQPSLRVTLTEADTRLKTDYRKALSIIDAANLAGFDTWWISNQQPIRGTYSAIGHQADNTIFISNDFHGSDVNRYDSHILPKLEQALAAPGKRKVIFIHLMGSHLQYEKRFPEDFKRFNSPPYFAYTTELSDQQKGVIDSYDNSILFNDWILDSALKSLKAKADETTGQYSLIYLSDHGEEVFDSLNFKGHGPDNVTASMLEIPFIVWVSEQYAIQNSEKIDLLKSHTETRFMLDDLFHLSLDLMQIQSTALLTSKSLLSESYSSKPRIVYGRDYDRNFTSKEKLVQTN